MKLLFIPNWNGHLCIAEHDDTSIKSLFDKTNYDNKEILEIPKNNIDEALKVIRNRTSQEKDFLLSIVGDHSNTYPLIESFSEKNKDFKLVIFDAHPDTEISTDAISHEDYLRNLIDNEIIKPEKVYLLGIRTFSRVELDYLNEKGVNYLTSADMIKDKTKAEQMLKQIEGDIYLSIDIDAIDPSEAPGTYYAEHGGITSDELLNLITMIKPQIKSADITEFYKEKDVEEKTEKLVLKFIEEFI